MQHRYISKDRHRGTMRMSSVGSLLIFTESQRSRRQRRPLMASCSQIEKNKYKQLASSRAQLNESTSPSLASPSKHHSHLASSAFVSPRVLCSPVHLDGNPMR